MVKQLKKDTIISLGMLFPAFLILFILCIVFRDSLAEKFQLNFIKGENYIEILKGLGNTLLITGVAFFLGLLLGGGLCIIEGIQSQNTFLMILKKLARIYISIFRGTPTTVQLLIIYFVIFAFYKGNPVFIAMLAFGLNSGAYVSEILRGGIQAVPKGQMEAGRSLGLSYSTVMIKIIFPQALKNALPSLGNEFITLLKETSVAGFIGAVDLTLAFRKIATATYDFETVYLVMGVVYFILVFFIALGLKQLERKLMKHGKA